MLLGKILAEAAMREDKFVTWLPAYGAEVRGGAAYCMVTVSNEGIGSPYIDKASALIAMNKLSLERFKSRIEKKGLLVINSSLADVALDKDARIFRHPFTDIAIRLGNIKVANMAALGCLIAHKDIVGLRSVLEAISASAPQEKKELISINKKALEEGMRLR